MNERTTPSTEVTATSRGGDPSATTCRPLASPNHQNDGKEHSDMARRPSADDQQAEDNAEHEVDNVVAFPSPAIKQERETQDSANDEDGAVDSDSADHPGRPPITGSPSGRIRRELAPILPGWLAEPGQMAANLRWYWRYCHHTARFHALRLPLYGARLAAATPRGLHRSVLAWQRWAYDGESRPLRHAMVDASDTSAYMQLARQRDARVNHRLKLTLSAALLVVLVVGVLLLVAPQTLRPLGWATAGTVALAFGLIGRREDKPIAQPAVVGQAAAKLTPDVVVRAFVGAGLCKPDNPVTFAQPIQRQGKGWLAVIDLPYGVPASKAVKKLDELSSGLHVNPVTVFLDADVTSARRVRLWVSDIDVFAQKPVGSPLARMERFDFWKPIPFGLDARDRRVRLPLIWSSLLVGAIPRMGKTFAARIVAAAAALDPFVELVVFNGKGDRSWGAFEKVAVAYGSGVRDQVVSLLVATLEQMVADMNDRFERMSTLPVDLCPEDKLTPGLARNKRMRMPLTVLCIDEIQRYLEHEVHGETVLALLTDLAKVGPAAGYMLVLATQKPDGQVIPDSLRGQLGTRFAMKVMTWQASDTILGAGSHSAGLDASKLKRSHKGVGILLGADDGELAEEGGQTVRTDLLSSTDVEALCERGRVLRVEAGTLTGMAAGEIPVVETTTSVLDDLAHALAAVAGNAAGAHTETVLGQLAQMRPELYDGWSATTLAGALRPHGVEPEQVWAATPEGAKRNRQGYKIDAITEAQSRRIDTNTSAGR